MAVGRDLVLPTGTVTLLLADVEGSTQLWERRPAEMQASMNEMNASVDDVVPAFGGVRPMEQGEGDSFVVAFTRGSDAIACALELQSRMAGGLLRLRMGIHTGEIEVSGDRYDGPTIIRAARLRDLAHGGQVVISASLRDLAQDALPPDTTLVDLGSHRLKGLDRAERVSQVNHPSLPGRFPPLRSEAKAGTLPVQLTTFVGRADELTHAKRLVRKNRMVTLTGAGGCGKTRLAIEAVGQLTESFDDVWFCDLAPLNDPALVAQAIRAALGLRESVAKDDFDVVCEHLERSDAVIVLDNCEHLVDAVAQTADAMLRRCEDLHLVATTREPLGVQGEIAWRVPSLADDDAIALFVERAERVQPHFALTGPNEDAVRKICTRLDGIPLAVELAAARLRILSLQHIVDGLGDRFRMLGRGSRTVLARQQTLLASVSWSHDLLDDDQRVALRRLSVFAGPFSIEAAQDVVGGDGIDREAALDLITQLVDRSLLVADETTTDVTFRMLETIRQFARDRLVDAGEADATAARHLAHYERFFAGLQFRVRTQQVEHAVALAHVIRSFDNIRAAMEWAVETGASEHGSSVVTSIALLNALEGRPGWQSEVQHWLVALLRDPDGTTPRTRARGLVTLSFVYGMENCALAAEAAEEAVRISREIGDRNGEATGLAFAGFARGFSSPDDGLALLDEALDIAFEVGDTFTQVYGLFFRSQVYGFAGPQAMADARRAIEVAESVGAGAEYQRIALSACLGMICDFDGALEQLEIARRSFDQRPGWQVKADALVAGYRFYQGHREEARRVLDRCMTWIDEMQGDVSFSFAPHVLAQIEVASGNLDRADEVIGHLRSLVPLQPPGPVADAMAHAADGLRAVTHLARGQDGQARRAIEASTISDTLARSGWMGYATTGLQARAVVARRLGEVAEAESYVAQALAATALGIWAGASRTLALAASLRCDVDAFADAVRLFAASHAADAATGVYHDPTPYPIWDERDDIAAAKAALGDDAFEEAWTSGSALTLREAVEFAMRGRGPRQRPSAGWDALTPTERKVVELVAAGMSNPQVAERLFVSRRTVSTHLSHVFTKLGVSSRSELAHEATKRGVVNP